MKEQLLMIPGTLCDAGLFKHQITGLKNIANCKVVSNSSSDDMRVVAANIIKEADDTFSILGLSYGGILAFEIWRQAPDRINKLILLNTNYKKPSKTTETNQKRFVEMAEKGQLKQVTTDILIDAMLHPEHAKNEQLRQAVLQMALNIGEEGFYKQVKAQLARPDSSKNLKNITCPTLIITGREDNICPLDLHKEMEQMIPKATLKIIEHCGHLSTMEQPDKVNNAIKAWWK